MYPVTNVQLPECFKYAARINKIVNVNYQESAAHMEEWLKNWENVILKY